jgi:formamidopyrimidine-DNA glycosylase
MPELPEVETVRRGLAPVLDGRRITRVQLNRADLRFPFPPRFAERLTGARITTLGRRAKYLLVPLDTGETLVIHLGMSGRVLVEETGAVLEPGDFYYGADRHLRHDHVIIEIEGGQRLIYNDVRRFGFMLLEASETLDEHESFISLGPEPLGNAFDAKALLSALDGRFTPIKSALLDQSVVAGLGNIYVCEALHRVGVSPFRAAHALSADEAEALVVAIRTVLSEAIEAGGSTLRDYRLQDGSLGYFQHRFRVYDRASEACPTPGCAGVIERQVQAGRSSFFCETCQH